VNHLEGHLLACELTSSGRINPLEFPLVALLVSGGHTELWKVSGYGSYRLMGRTRDDAAGEAFDKVAKLLGLGYPGGPEVDLLARKGDPFAVRFPRPYLPGSWDFSFSGLKTAVAYYLRDLGGRRLRETQKAGICASFQEAVCDTLAEKTVRAAIAHRVVNIAVGGGVAANSRLRACLSEKAAAAALKARFVDKAFCMDNAAMIAMAGWRRLSSGVSGGRPSTTASAGKNALSSVDIDPELKIRSWA
ncbi:MAG: tRNA (adenosine(37)-N6)-threonylcarbamoyltransferase complex transferase subunit TsaD, partial [bacterium]